MKYRPEFPERFGSVQHGRAFGHVFFPWYNEAHHHSALGFLTPAVVHYGLADGVRDLRQRVLADAFAAHPERFVKGTPQPAALPRAVWINPPERKTTHQDSPRSTQAAVDDLRVDPVRRTYSHMDDSSIAMSLNRSQH
jgi:putative transposase